MTDENRRKCPRANYPCQAILRFEGNPQDRILAQVKNIGSGGICVLLKNQVKIFTSMEIEIELFDFNERIKCRGKVIWQRASNKENLFETGLQLVDIEEKDRLRLIEVSSRLKHS